jgi:signal transduction histidine kinase
MKRPLSLRTHVWLGALLWTVGLFIMVSALLITAMELHPQVPAILTVHDIFRRPLVLLLGVGALVVGVVQVRLGLAPIDRIRSRLAGVHDGRDRRVHGTYPAEVQPLVSDLNELLDHREQAVRRAVGKAGDLAHGLKTPLAILAQEAERAKAAGHADMAGVVMQQVARMKRQVDYHLAQARAAASGAAPGVHCSIAESAEGLTRALRRLYAERGIDIGVHVAPDLSVRVQREDLDEMLGNLLDNACTWGRAHVIVAAERTDTGVEITVDDDGPGLAEDLREAVLHRGVRADEAAPGSGLGLAIVRDLAEVYAGSVSLEASSAGGLRARLRLPAHA